MDNDDVARSSACLARSEEWIARQRAHISELTARGKPADLSVAVLARMEANLRVMQKVHHFIETSRTQLAWYPASKTKPAAPVANSKKVG